MWIKNLLESNVKSLRNYKIKQILNFLKLFCIRKTADSKLLTYAKTWDFKNYSSACKNLRSKIFESLTQEIDTTQERIEVEIQRYTY